MNIDGNTKVCALFGDPVAHSFSPAMHNAAFQALGLNLVYLPFQVKPDHLGQAVEAVRSLQLTGINVTVPHKQRIIPYLDQIDPAARLIGAVNTVLNQDGKLVGYNTDGAGFIRALQAAVNFVVQGKRVLLLGAGGAARAVAAELALAGAELALANRSPAKARELAGYLHEQTGMPTAAVPWGGDLPAAAVQAADLVIQATPIGMHPLVDQTIAFPFAGLHPGQVVCDLVYNPVQTLFLKEAAAAGAAVVSGLGMLLYQAVLAFEIWTHRAAPVAVMQEALDKLRRS